jgi:hypothetical protein
MGRRKGGGLNAFFVVSSQTRPTYWLYGATYSKHTTDENNIK